MNTTTCDCPAHDEYIGWGECQRGFCAKCLTELGTDEDWGALCESCEDAKWERKTHQSIVDTALVAYAWHLFHEGDNAGHQRVLETLRGIRHETLSLREVTEDQVPF